MKLRSILAFILALCLLAALPGCRLIQLPGLAEPSPSPAPPVTPSPEPTPEPTEPPRAGYHTLRLGSETAPACWNVHAWVSETDSFLWSLTVSPLVDIGLKETAEGTETVWLYPMAESVEDVTAVWPDKAAWGIGEEETGRVWRIRLRSGACWDDEMATPITAEDYIYSMRQCLSPEMDNFRAEAFCQGPAALLGSQAYRRSGTESWEENAQASGVFRYPEEDWVEDGNGLLRGPDGTFLYFSLSQPLSVWLDGSSLEDYYRAGYVPEEIYASLLALADEGGFVPVTRESADLLYTFTGSDAWGRERREDLAYYTVYRSTWPETTWDGVGLLKEDEHTLLYLSQEHVSEFDLLFALTTPWLVYGPLYEQGRYSFDGKSYTDYCTSAETTVSCGPYRLVSMNEAGCVLERNDRWVGYRDEDAPGLYETDRIVLQNVSHSELRRLFAQGELDALVPARGETLPEGAEALTLCRDDAYTYRFFMVTDPAALHALEAAEDGDGKVNKVCLAYDAFRDALSFALDRARFAQAAGEPCRPALGLIGPLYYGDVEHDLNSRYRDTLPALSAICNAYGVNLSGVTDPAGLRDAALACTGYEPGKARRLFQVACDLMGEDGVWDEDMTVHLNCAVGSGELTPAQIAQNELMQQLLDEATNGTDLQGKLTITFCTRDNRYAAVASGEIEMGFGAWGGAPFDPYGLMQCYCDPAFNTVQERCGFDPTQRLLTLLPEGDAVTATYTEWCRSLLPGGDYAGEPYLRLQLLAGLETALLKERRFIVTGVGTQELYLSPKLLPGSEEYSILTGFGGIRSLHYRYDDAQWASR